MTDTYLEIKNLKNKIWWTRKARIEAEKRLLANKKHCEIILLWYSFCSVGASIYFLEFQPQNKYAPITWVIFSVAVFVITSFINGMRILERSTEIKQCYETLNTLSQSNDSVQDLSKRYKETLDKCENHLESDFLKAVVKTYILEEDKSELTKQPNKLMYITFFWNLIFRFCYLSTIYIFPLLLFYLFEFYVI